MKKVKKIWFILPLTMLMLVVFIGLGDFIYQNVTENKQIEKKIDENLWDSSLRVKKTYESTVRRKGDIVGIIEKSTVESYNLKENTVSITFDYERAICSIKENKCMVEKFDGKKWNYIGEMELRKIQKKNKT